MKNINNYILKISCIIFINIVMTLYLKNQRKLTD